MSVNIRYPNITGLSEKEQLVQIKSYLHQLVEQLNYALPTLGTGEVASQSASSQSEDISYEELRAFVIQELQAIEASFDQLSNKMQSEYVKDDELPQAIEDALAQAKESGEFDGPPGEKGDPGSPGEDGFSPIITITAIEGGHRVTITDVDGTESFDVLDGKDGSGESSGTGTDGYSPTISVEEIEGGHRLTITDVNGTRTVDVLDGITPEKGVDYFTEEDINSAAVQAAGKISFTLDEEGNLYYEVEE